MSLRFDPSEHAPRVLAVLAMAMLTLAGGLLAAVTAVLPPAAEGSEALVLAIGGMSALLGALLLARKPELGERGLGALALFGTALITVATREGGVAGGTADNEILYLWVVLYAFYFLTLPGALLQTAVVGAAYAWVLSSQVSYQLGLTQWLVTMSSLLVAGLLIAQLRGRLYRLVDELSDRARRDSLTGLHNRGSLDERYEVERARSARDGSPVSLLAVDVDEFKALNDTEGHHAGDEILRQVAATLRHWTREIDIAARVGGDEFAVVLPGTDASDALSVAADLRGAVARSLAPDQVRLTISIGVTTAAAPAPSLSELWQAADAAMYEAKRSGGDGVAFRGDPGTPPPAPQPAPPSAAERGLTGRQPA